jgi:hypothetical protein
MKKCNKCEIEKNESEFAKGPKYKDKQYLRGECKVCQKLYARTDKCKKQAKEYRTTEEFKENRKAYRKLESVKKRERKYELDHMETRKINRKKRHIVRYSTDILYKLKILCRNRIRDLTKIKKWRKSQTLKDYLGCTPDELRVHIEKQFKPGMTWENHGKYTWHIDHIIPLASANTVEEMYKLCHYTNLQPLPAHDNMVKQDKILPISE